MQAQLRDILLIIAVTLSAVFGGMYYAAKEQSETTINLLVRGWKTEQRFARAAVA